MYHPHQSPTLPKLFLNHIYSLLPRSQLKKDCTLLGISLSYESEDEQISKLVCKSGDGELKRIVKTHATNPANTTSDIKSLTSTLSKTTTSTSNLLPSEKQKLLNLITTKAYTNFGNRFENDALDQYGKMVGAEVYGRNEDFWVWEFYSACDNTFFDGEVKGGWANRAIGGRARVYRDEDDDETSLVTDTDKDNSTTKATIPPPSPLFKILGIMDGFISVDFDSDFNMLEKVVELKHRIHRLSSSSLGPPLYDVIQLVCYMLVSGLDRGVLVECMRDGIGEEEDFQEEEEDEDNSAKLVCPKNHPCNKHTTKHSRFSCDLCRSRVGCNSIMMGCRVCDWDICQICIEKEGEKKADERIETPVNASIVSDAELAIPVANGLQQSKPQHPPPPLPAPQRRKKPKITQTLQTHEIQITSPSLLFSSNNTPIQPHDNHVINFKERIIPRLNAYASGVRLCVNLTDQALLYDGLNLRLFLLKCMVRLDLDNVDADVLFRMKVDESQDELKDGTRRGNVIVDVQVELLNFFKFLGMEYVEDIKAFGVFVSEKKRR